MQQQHKALPATKSTSCHRGVHLLQHTAITRLPGKCTVQSCRPAITQPYKPWRLRLHGPCMDMGHVTRLPTLSDTLPVMAEWHEQPQHYSTPSHFLLTPHLLPHQKTLCLPHHTSCSFSYHTIATTLTSICIHTVPPTRWQWQWYRTRYFLVGSSY
jgi:hypothetical protein